MFCVKECLYEVLHWQVCFLLTTPWTNAGDFPVKRSSSADLPERAKKNTTHFKFANQVGPDVVSKRAIPVCQTCKDSSKLSRGESNSALLRKEPFRDDLAG